MTIYFTSDLHFGHQNVIKYSNRPFQTAAEMDHALIKAWNDRVTSSDHIYILGDVSFVDATSTEAILMRLNGQKHLVYGNHDKVLRKNMNLRTYFVECKDIIDLTVTDDTHPYGKQHIVLCHYPMLTWNKAHHGSWMLHGHSHGSCKYPYPKACIMDVGVDCVGYEPISYEDIRALMVNREDIVHHGD